MTEPSDGSVYTWHAVQRAWERYGIDASPGDWLQAFLDITGVMLGEVPPRAILLAHKHALGGERWAVRLGRHSVIAVYEPDRAQIVTVLPMRDRNLVKRYATPPRQAGRVRRETDDRYRHDWAAEAADA